MSDLIDLLPQRSFMSKTKTSPAQNLALVSAAISLACATTVFAQETATMNRDSNLLATGAAGAQVVVPLPKGSEIEIIERQGAFTRVKAQGKTGFVSVFHFTPKNIAVQGASSSGGGSIRTSAATVGARGLGREDFENVTPNAEEFEKFDRLRSPASTGQSHASRARLASNTSVPFVDATGKAAVMVDFSGEKYEPTRR
jgi:hypothetical protein